MFLTNKNPPGHFDGLDYVEYQKLEEEAIRLHEERNVKIAHASPSNPKQNLPRPSTAASTEVGDTPACWDSSVTPAYAPPPRRMIKKKVVMQSPYAHCLRKKSYKCSKDVCQVYNTVCRFTQRSTRSTKRNEVIINYPFFYVSLGHLADSVRPGWKLKNTVAEIAIYAIDGKKSRGLSNVYSRCEFQHLCNLGILKGQR